MSRNRKPLEMQSKHLTNAEKLQKEEEEDLLVLGKEQLQDPPDWLINDVAINEFKRIVKEIDKIDVIGNLDINNLGGYCNSFANYIIATEELKSKSFVSRKMTKNGPIIIKNPWVEIQKNYADEMRKFASLCGMTIDSRLKVATIKTTQQQENIIDEFGDI